MKVLIFGGTRFMGRYVLKALLDAGAEVTVANRGSLAPNEGSNNVICDRSRPGSLEQFTSSQFDVVVDFSAYSSEWVKEAGEFFRNKIYQYIFISSTAVYSNSSIFPITEDFPIGPPHAFATYAAEKLRAENFLVDFSEKNYFKTVSCRLPFVLGSDNYEDRESFVFSRLLHGDSILLANNGKFIHSFIYAGDVARAVLALMNSADEVNAESFNVAIPQTVTSYGFVELASEIAGRKANIVSYDPGDYNLDPNVFDLRNVAFPFPPFNAYFSSEKIKKAIGFEPKENLKSMLEIYYTWWKANCDLIPKEYPLEQRILQSVGGASTKL